MMLDEFEQELVRALNDSVIDWVADEILVIIDYRVNLDSLSIADEIRRWLLC